MDVAVKVNERHAFEEGVDAEPNNESRDWVIGSGMAVSGMSEMRVMVLTGFGLFFTTGTVVVSVFGSTCQLLEEQLDEEANHDGGSNFEMDARGDETEWVVVEKDVGDEIDETRGKEECPTEDGDVGGYFGADMFASGDKDCPYDDTQDDEQIS